MIDYDNSMSVEDWSKIPVVGNGNTLTFDKLEALSTRLSASQRPKMVVMSTPMSRAGLLDPILKLYDKGSD